jgi:hypothetical protein
LRPDPFVEFEGVREANAKSREPAGGVYCDGACVFIKFEELVSVDSAASVEVGWGKKRDPTGCAESLDDKRESSGLVPEVCAD